MMFYYFYNVGSVSILLLLCILEASSFVFTQKSWFYLHCYRYLFLRFMSNKQKLIHHGFVPKVEEVKGVMDIFHLPLDLSPTHKKEDSFQFQEKVYSGLDVNVLHRFRYLDAWFPTWWLCLGGV